MEIEFKGSEIILSKELSMLDSFVSGFANMLAGHNIKYVIVSDYIAILFGKNQTSECVDFLMNKITFEKFLKLWLEFEKAYECLNTDDPIDAYNGYLRNAHAIRIAKRGSFVPYAGIRFIKNEIERYSMKYRKRVKLGDELLFISPLEIQIPYSLSLGSEKDLEDAGFLFKLFRERLDMGLLDRSLTELNIPEESVKKYLGKS